MAILDHQSSHTEGFYGRPIRSYGITQLPVDDIEGIIRARRNRNNSFRYFPSLLAPKTHIYYPPDIDTTAAAYYNRHRPIILEEYGPQNVRAASSTLFGNLYSTRKYTHFEYVETMRPTKRKMYRDALQDLEAGMPVNNRVLAFTKIEKQSTGNYKAPRLIQSRSPKFNILYGSYIKSLEKSFIKQHPNIIVKGTYDEVGHTIYELSKKWTHYTEGDHSTFDAHVTTEMLKLTHKFYKKCFKHDKNLSKLCNSTLVNNISTRNGLKWKSKATRMSGDVDTSFGNSLINYSILTHLLSRMYIPHHIIVQGDDFIIFTNETLNHDFIAKALRMYNMETKLQPTTTNIHTVDYCKTKLTINQGQPTMHPDPSRLLQRFGMTYSNLGNYQHYLLELLYCMSCCNRNTTIGQHFSSIYSYLITTHKISPENEKKIKKIKHVGRDQRWLYEHQKNNKPITTHDIDYSTLYAQPSIIQIQKKFKKLKNHINNLFHHPPIRTTDIQHNNDTFIVCHNNRTASWRDGHSITRLITRLALTARD